MLTPTTSAPVTPGASITTPSAPSAPALLPPDNLPLPALSPPATPPPPARMLIGEVDLRTPEEELEFQECEGIVRQSWTHFARLGEALARIRDKKLYKNEHYSFETYCRERWGYGHTQAWRYIRAAEAHKMLGSIPGIPLPECEAQIRPLVGLSDELAQKAWLHALSCSPGGVVTARLVKRAVKAVLRDERDEQPVVPAEPNAVRQKRYRLRESVRTGFKELLTLLMGRAERDVLIAKVQEIERLLEPLLNPKKTRP